MRSLSKAIVLGMMLAVGGTTGCESDYNRDTAAGQTDIWIDSSADTAFVGDTITFISHTKDTYGRDAKVTWTASSGSIDTSDEGRIARVKFDQPGTYSVRAQLEIEGQVVHTDMAEVRVKPLH